MCKFLSMLMKFKYEVKYNPPKITSDNHKLNTQNKNTISNLQNSSLNAKEKQNLFTPSYTINQNIFRRP